MPYYMYMTGYRGTCIKTTTMKGSIRKNKRVLRVLNYLMDRNLGLVGNSEKKRFKKYCDIDTFREVYYYLRDNGYVAMPPKGVGIVVSVKGRILLAKVKMLK